MRGDGPGSRSSSRRSLRVSSVLTATPFRQARSGTGLALMSATVLSIVWGAFFAPGSAAAQFPSDTEILEILQARMADRAGGGIVVGLLESDGTTRVVFAGSAGEEARALGPETVFEIGSITKVFTGTLLADMVRRREVSLEDPVSRHLPTGVQVPSRRGREITMVDLATHRSGLPRLPTNFEPSDPTNPYADFGADELYAFLSGYELTRDIGPVFEYSNLGVGLLGHALSRAANADYVTLVRERVLAPLGMEKTGIEVSDEMRDWMAQGHDDRGNPAPLWDSGVLAGAGGLKADMHDMLRFLDANVGEPESALEVAMRDAHVTQPAAEARGNAEASSGSPLIGLNWLGVSAGDSVIVWHNGGTGGFRSFIGFDPRRAIGVVVLTNAGRSIDDIGLYLLDPAIPLTDVASGWIPGWPVVLVLLGFVCGVVALEVTGRPRRHRLNRSRA